MLIADQDRQRGQNLQQLEITILGYVIHGVFAGYADLRKFGFHMLVYLSGFWGNSVS